MSTFLATYALHGDKRRYHLNTRENESELIDSPSSNDMELDNSSLPNAMQGEPLLDQKAIELIASKEISLDFFILLLGFFGHCLMKTGFGERRHVVYNLMMPLVHLCIGVLVFWAVGMAFANGKGNIAIGEQGFFASDFKSWILEVLPILFCSSIIQSGGLDRTCFGTDVTITIMTSLILIPLPIRWCWSDVAWLKEYGFRDFSGSCIYHAISGMSGFILTYFSGKRALANDIIPFHLAIGFAEKQRKSGHNLVLATFGGILTLFGLICIPTYSMSKKALDMPKEFMLINCMLSSASGGLVSLFVSRLIAKEWSVFRIIFGMMSGLICASAGLDKYIHWHCIVVGSLGGLFYVMARNCINRSNLDDALEVFSIHFIPGIAGLFAAPILMNPDGLVYEQSADSGWIVAWTLAGGFLLALWSLLPSVIVFGGLYIMGILNISKDDLELGRDVGYMRECPYLFISGGSNNSNSPGGNQGLDSFIRSPGNGIQMTSTKRDIFNQSVGKKLNNTSTHQKMGPRLVIESPNVSFSTPMSPDSNRRPPDFFHDKSVNLDEEAKSASEEGISSLNKATTENAPAPQVQKGILNNASRTSLRARLQDLNPNERLQKRTWFPNNNNNNEKINETDDVVLESYRT